MNTPNDTVLEQDRYKINVFFRGDRAVGLVKLPNYWSTTIVDRQSLAELFYNYVNKTIDGFVFCYVRLYRYDKFMIVMRKRYNRD